MARVTKQDVSQALLFNDFHQGIVGDALVVSAKPGGTNKWGVKHPVSSGIQFDYTAAKYGWLHFGKKKLKQGFAVQPCPAVV